MLIDVHGQPVYCYSGSQPLRADLPALVLLHGAQNDHSVWALQSRYFAHHGYNVLAPDLPGHGRSAGPALSSVEAMATWLLALLDAAGIGLAALCGHSMGSLIALEACYQAPERISHLALLGSSLPMKVAPALLDSAREQEARAIDMVNIWSHASLLAPSAQPGVHLVGAAQRLMQRMAVRNPQQLLLNDFSACNAYSHGELAAQAVRCPTLLLGGSRDVMTPPKSARQLASLIPHARSVLVDSGHSMMSEQPDAVLEQLRSFLRT